MRDLPPTRRQLLKLAFLFQGGLLLCGLLWGKWIELDWKIICRFEGPALLRGLLATVPLSLFLWLSLFVPWTPFLKIKEFMLRVLAPLLRQCTLFDLLLLSLLAGISEEIFFRGAMQTAFSSWGFWPAVIVTNLVFGACHALSIAYFVLATLAGLYLSWVAGTEQPNLVPAIIAHAAYDFVALIVIVRRAPVEPAEELTGGGYGIPPESDQEKPESAG